MQSIPVFGERFEFDASAYGLGICSLPSLNSLPVRQVMEIRAVGSDGLEQLVSILDRECPGLCDALPVEALSWLVEAWREHSGISLGESSASPTA